MCSRMCYSADGLRGSIDKTERLYREFVSKVVEESTERNTLTGKGGVKNTGKKVAISAIERYSGWAFGRLVTCSEAFTTVQ